MEPIVRAGLIYFHQPTVRVSCRMAQSARNSVVRNLLANRHRAHDYGNGGSMMVMDLW